MAALLAERKKWLTLLVACGCHLVWGCQPVLTRYLQTRGDPPDKLSVICVTQLMSWVFATSASWCRRRCSASKGRRSDTLTVEDEWSASKWYRVAFFYGMVTAARASTNFVSTGLTSAWHITMVAMSSPFITAGLSRCMLGERVDRRVWPSVVAAIFGSAMVVSGEWRRESDATGALLGGAVQVLSIVFSGTARVMMKATAGRYDSTELMTFQYATAVTVVGVAATCVRGMGAWRPWLELGRGSWAAAIALSLCIQWGAAESQVVLIRELSPALYTSFQPLRIVSTVLLGVLVLGEAVRGARQWLGLAIVAIAVATFLARRLLWPVALAVDAEPAKAVELVKNGPSVKGAAAAKARVFRDDRPFPPFMRRTAPHAYVSVPVSANDDDRSDDEEAPVGGDDRQRDDRPPDDHRPTEVHAPVIDDDDLSSRQLSAQQADDGVIGGGAPPPDHATTSDDAR